MAMTPRGITATPEVLMARNSAIASVDTPLRVFRLSSSRIAFNPKGVAALPSPSMLAARFMIMAPMAGWSGGMEGKSRRMTGAKPCAIACMRPASRKMRMKPSQSAIIPMRPMAMVTAPLAESMPAWFTSVMRPVNAATATEPRISTMKIPFSTSALSPLGYRGEASGSPPSTGNVAPVVGVA